MSRIFELWDSTSRNLIGAYESETDALAFVRAYVDQHGSSYPTAWILLWDDDTADKSGQIAMGPALLERAGNAPPVTSEPPAQIPGGRRGRQAS